VILVAVGTSANGFDELVEAADRAAASLGVPGLAQIGHGRLLPLALRWERFLPDTAFRDRLAEAHVVVCHGGMGILGEAMRARRPIIAVPRRGATSASNPTNDQLELLRRLAERQPIALCEEPAALAVMLRDALAQRGAPVDYELASDIPQRIASFLSARAAPR
jgi:UDP-N-acetylglucosamine transferase subunit ALG13